MGVNETIFPGSHYASTQQLILKKKKIVYSSRGGLVSIYQTQMHGQRTEDWSLDGLTPQPTLLITAILKIMAIKMTICT